MRPIEFTPELLDDGHGGNCVGFAAVPGCGGGTLITSPSTTSICTVVVCP